MSLRFVFVLLAIVFCGCVYDYPPYYQDGYYSRQMHSGANYEMNCISNPYVYRLDPGAWRTWERKNYNVSCTKYITPE